MEKLILEGNLPRRILTKMLLPRQYQAENLEDLAENSDKTKTPFYQITKYLFQFCREEYPGLYFSRNGTLIQTPSVILSCNQESDYLYKLNAIQNEKILEIIHFDWEKLQDIIIEKWKDYIFKRPVKIQGIVTEYKYNSQLTTDLVYKIKHEIEQFTETSLRGFMPPTTGINSTILKRDFKEPSKVEELTTFYSHLDGRWYLWNYTKDTNGKQEG